MTVPTTPNRPRWPAIAEHRRVVVPTRTATGEPCTLIVERDESGLILSFHGALRTTAAPCPAELAELIEALQRARARCS